MRDLDTADRVRGLMRAMGEETREDCRVYFTGASRPCWWDGEPRPSTPPADRSRLGPVDAGDTGLEGTAAHEHRAGGSFPVHPGAARLARTLALRRTPRHRLLLHYDFYAQALAKIERGEATDIGDVEQMLARGLVDRAKAWDLFQQIEPQLYRYPAIDGAEFRRSVAAVVGPV